jgi:catechol 2,3-dioxygenase-like lactoylglutathione lyase family enzyme
MSEHTGTRIVEVRTVSIPVSDVDRSKAFYSEQCGFIVDVDQAMSDEFRGVQMTPPGSACSVTIGKGRTGSVPGSLEGLQLVVTDIEAAREELVGRGLDGHGGPWNSFMFFSDPDGNGWAIQQKPARP